MRGTYTGDLVDGVRQGSGVLVFANGDRYEGAFVQGFRHGHGVFTSERGNRIYDGEWRRSEKHGIGKEKWLASGDRYEGEYEKDVFHGKGSLFRGTSNSKYDGEFQNGKKHGHGRMEFVSNTAPRGKPTGNPDLKAALSMMGIASSGGSSSSSSSSSSVYKGGWKDGRMHGEGKYTRADGSFYDGTWLDGFCHGYGKEMVLARCTRVTGKKGFVTAKGASRATASAARACGKWGSASSGQQQKCQSSKVDMVFSGCP